jgi:hypothetical protein
MNRRLLFILIAAALTAGCATHRTPEAEALTSDIFGAAAQNRACQAGEASYCLVRGSHIKSVDQDRRCECAPQNMLTEPRLR